MNSNNFQYEENSFRDPYSMPRPENMGYGGNMMNFMFNPDFLSNPITAYQYQVLAMYNATFNNQIMCTKTFNNFGPNFSYPMDPNRMQSNANSDRNYQKNNMEVNLPRPMPQLVNAAVPQQKQMEIPRIANSVKTLPKCQNCEGWIKNTSTLENRNLCHNCQIKLNKFLKI